MSRFGSQRHRKKGPKDAGDSHLLPLSTYDFRKNRSDEIYAVCKCLTKILPDCSTFLLPILIVHTKIVGVAVSCLRA